MDKKAIPVGIENFERIIKDGYYYVDKSLLIEKILENIDLDEVRLIDILLLDENISNRITEILSREDAIFKSDMNIEEKDTGIVLESFEKRDLEEKMKSTKLNNSK